MRCLYCDKYIDKQNLYSIFIEEDKLCVDCRNKLSMKRRIIERNGLKVETFYEYDSLFKSILIQYKESCDEALKDVLLYRISDYINIRYFDYQILFVPSSNYKLQYRGFNHLEEMFEKVKLKRVTGLRMKNDLYQEGKSRSERLLMQDNYVYEGDYLDKVLIVDDVLTTGSSLRGVYDNVKVFSKKRKLLSLAYKYLQTDNELLYNY